MYHFDWIRRHAERTPDKLALVDAHTGQQWTYAELDARINQLANFMHGRLGLRQGDRISLLAQNSADYFVILFACGRLGVILNTLNWRLTAPELAYILADCTPSALFYEAMFAPVVDQLRPDLLCDQFVVLGESASAGEWVYEAAIQGETAVPPLSPRLTYDDIWAIIYTSGTTGHPKGAQVTYGNFFYNAIGMGQAIQLTADDVNLNVLPTFHIGGLGLYAGPTLHAGGTLVVMRAFDPAQFMALVQQYQVSVLLLVPAIYLMLSQYAEFDPAKLSSIRHWASGGSSLPPNLVHLFAAKGIIIQQGFGMTETGPTVFIITREDAVRKAGSVGKPVLHTDVTIRDREGNVLGPNEVGELCIRGGNVTSGYWNRPEATAKALIDGWLHSGDAAMVDDEGFYTIVDRWKDMYISGGENVYPAEVENVMYGHTAVAEVAVIGVPHAKWQEVGRALIVLKEGQSATEQELIDFCQGKLARYKIPKSVVFVDKPLPRTAAGKVLKRELREEYGAEVV
ncbi:MAG: long-chain fatty acid--CoA ligase [Chloroflexi bacterium]|nr:long-chain fatty acid--CoA ligase [Chloroflexota bacterium]